MKKQDWLNIWCLFKDVIAYERKTVICGVTAALLNAIKPYIYVILMGKLIDMLYEGADWQSLIMTIVITVGMKFVLDTVRARLSESFGQKLENPKEFGT